MCCCEDNRCCRCKPKKPLTAESMIDNMVQKEPEKDKVHIAYGENGQLVVHVNGQGSNYVLRPGDTMTLNLTREWRVW